MKKDTKKGILIAIVAIVALIAVYIGVLTLVFLLPEHNLNYNRPYSMVIIDGEGSYPSAPYNVAGAVLDNETDKVMILTTEKDPQAGAFTNAINMLGYARYWHGYMVFLRPLLSFFDVYMIRRIVAVINLALFFLTFVMLHKRLSYKVAVPFAVSWICFYCFAVAASFQYFASYAVTYIAMIMMLCLYKNGRNLNLAIPFFAITGSVINFLDLLTFPLLTLTMPLTLMVLIALYEEKRKPLRVAVETIICSLTWALSYGITWFAKWLLAAIVLKRDMTYDVLFQAQYRMTGDIEGLRIEVLKQNIAVPILFQLVLIVGLLMLLASVTIIPLKNKKFTFTALPLCILALMPYVWYEVMCNHSLVHTFFTYRAQMGTMFIILVLLVKLFEAIRYSSRGFDKEK